MGKAKGGKGDKSNKGGPPKCTCDHPFQCSCGNRPERPSRGHKWDPETQQWGGKGHKQKGGSGQTSTVGQQAIVTAKGNTQIAQWQRLPSNLLDQFCSKQKRPHSKFKDIQPGNTKFKFRCIVPDAKDPEKDLFFVPANPVSNEEQAKEESALLALLQLTPTIPHERVLPEPYKTTWLTAIESQKSNNNNTKSKKQKEETSKSSNEGKKGPSISSVGSSGGGGGGNKATANTKLVSGTSFISTADKRRQQEEKKQQRNARIRKHEAVRMANRNHPVFLSAILRRKIQQILKGDTSIVLEDPAEDENDLDPTSTTVISDQQAYVEERLHHEGFTKQQARTAYKQSSVAAKHNTGSGVDDEDQWELVYEDCLQWLCVHLDEDMLPEGFDPRGQTLDVVVSAPASSTSDNKDKTKTSSSSNNQSKNGFSKQALQLASNYGMSDKDGAWLLEQSTKNGDGKTSIEDSLWTSLCQVAGLEILSQAQPADHGGELSEAAQEEREALEAMFAEDCHISVSKDGKLSAITISLPEEGLKLEILVGNASYPSILPHRVLLSGTWNTAAETTSSDKFGVALHVELIKFISTLALGEPMVFEIYSQLQSLLQAVEELAPLSLCGEIAEKATSSSSSFKPPTPNDGPKASEKGTVEKSTRTTTTTTTNRPSRSIRRPRQRGNFWSTPPEKMRPAVAFPAISKSLQSSRNGLPAAKARGEFLAALKLADQGSRAVLVTGDTGCGKSTQCCQYILEEAPKSAKIVVAQPRRIAATGVAGRVANERGENQPGTGSVGYVVRGQTALCDQTRILFCTFGILLRQLQNEGALDCITHILIDEVHERNLDGDVLMGLLKQLLVSAPHLRVVLMSATLDADRFASYWGKNTPRIHIPGRTFPVTDFLLEDVLSLTGYIPPRKPKKGNHGNFQQQRRPHKTSPWADSERSDNEEETGEQEDEGKAESSKTSTTTQTSSIPLEDLVNRMDETRTDYDMLGQLVRHLVREKIMGEDGSILVFLPGAPEINQAKTTIQKITRGMSILLLPLHGGLQPKEQNAVFQTSPNMVKVILSTNVAETSITIPDCTVVIDSCREKQSSYDPSNRMPMLLEQFASKASLKQRRGRAGRVREGICYKLISQATYSKIQEHTIPEIARCALDQTLLSLIFLGVEQRSGSFLRTLLDPPSTESVDAAVFSLWKMGALQRGTQQDELLLTPLGMHLAGIPAPPVVGKMLVMGSILGCRRGALAMAAAISVGRSPFLRIDTPRSGRRKTGENDQASLEEMKNGKILEERKKLFKLSGNSDHAMLAGAYLEWESRGQGGGQRKVYCESLGLSFNGMKDIAQLVNQLDSSLRAAGFDVSEESDRNASSWRILRACAVASMAPGQLVRLQRPSTKYVDTAEGALEKDGVAKELKFFIRQEEPPKGGLGADAPSTAEASSQEKKAAEERVFMHPSSANFAVGNYHCPWLVYHSLVRTSKAFLRDATECSAYALLLFGGSLDVQARNEVIVIDSWVNLAANARIGALIRGLRERMDDLLAQKIKNPTNDISNTAEMQLIVKLLVTDGLG